MRVGIGYDVHRLVKGRPLILGGETIPFEMGLEGHSDADVLTHAVCDALFGAAGLGDIGRHFPDTDPAFKDADSLKLLALTGEKIKARGFMVVNIDAVIVAQAPKLVPFMDKMRAGLAAALGIETDGINLKATTTEGLGAIGAGEGMAALATVMLERESEG